MLKTLLLGLILFSSIGPAHAEPIGNTSLDDLVFSRQPRLAEVNPYVHLNDWASCLSRVAAIQSQARNPVSDLQEYNAFHIQIVNLLAPRLHKELTPDCGIYLVFRPDGTLKSAEVKRTTPVSGDASDRTVLRKLLRTNYPEVPSWTTSLSEIAIAIHASEILNSPNAQKSRH